MVVQFKTEAKRVSKLQRKPTSDADKAARLVQELAVKDPDYLFVMANMMHTKLYANRVSGTLASGLKERAIRDRYKPDACRRAHQDLLS